MWDASTSDDISGVGYGAIKIIRNMVWMRGCLDEGGVGWIPRQLMDVHPGW